MATYNPTEPLPIGTPVKIRDSGYGRAWIVEYRGPLGPNGARIYRVMVRRVNLHLKVSHFVHVAGRG
jgi:hypothetical protein